MDKDGVFAEGENWCAVPQDTCPRLPNDGYMKCRTICAQPYHAEVSAVTGALRQGHGHKLKGAYAIITGINRICEDCEEVFKDVGITEWKFIE
jgi:hypothetical protein